MHQARDQNVTIEVSDRRHGRRRAPTSPCSRRGRISRCSRSSPAATTTASSASTAPGGSPTGDHPRPDRGLEPAHARPGRSRRDHGRRPRQRGQPAAAVALPTRSSARSGSCPRRRRDRVPEPGGAGGVLLGRVPGRRGRRARSRRCTRRRRDRGRRGLADHRSRRRCSRRASRAPPASSPARSAIGPTASTGRWRSCGVRSRPRRPRATRSSPACGRSRGRARRWAICGAPPTWCASGGATRTATPGPRPGSPRSRSSCSPSGGAPAPTPGRPPADRMGWRGDEIETAPRAATRGQAGSTPPATSPMPAAPFRDEIELATDAGAAGGRGARRRRRRALRASSPPGRRRWCEQRAATERE